jgi:hypothetical protein
MIMVAAIVVCASVARGMYRPSPNSRKTAWNAARWALHMLVMTASDA